MTFCELPLVFRFIRPSPADRQPTCCRIFDGTVPPHFYGELTKTEEGCHLLREKGHFVEFSQFIRQHGLEASDSDLLNKLKSVLWAVVSLWLCLPLYFLRDKH